MGYTIAMLGIAACVLLCGIGSCIGLYKTSTAAAGVLGEDPKKFGKVMVLVLLPATQGIYGFIIGIINIENNIKVVIKATLGFVSIESNKVNAGNGII